MRVDALTLGAVAVGLAILAKAKLGEEAGELVVAVVTTTVFLFEIAGPPMVRYAIVKSGEAGRDVTEEDLIRSHTVGDVMDKDPPSLHENTPLSQILRAFSQHDVVTFPVVDDERVLKGIVTIHEIRQSLATEGLENWLLATDLMGTVRFTTKPDAPLYDTLEEMRRLGVDYMPVVLRKDEKRMAGMLEMGAVHRAIMSEVLRRHAGEGYSDESS